jgi:hypothetical protein
MDRFPLKDSISALIAKYSSNGYLDILTEKWYGGLPCFKYNMDVEIVQPRPLGRQNANRKYHQSCQTLPFFVCLPSHRCGRRGWCFLPARPWHGARHFDSHLRTSVLQVHVADFAAQAEGYGVAQPKHYVLQPKVVPVHQLCGAGVAASCGARAGAHAEKGPDHQPVPEECQAS